MWPEDRRVAILYIGENDLLQAFVAFTTPTEYPQVRLVMEFDRYRDAKVVRVHHSWERRAFGLLLAHPAFDPVPDGGVPPVINDRLHWSYKNFDVKDDPHPLIAGE